MAEKEKIGEVVHYFPKAGAAAIDLTDGDLAVGDRILVQGVTTNFEQTVESMQIEREPVERGTKGQSVGVLVKDRVRERDVVFKLVD
jgi:putative protease